METSQNVRLFLSCVSDEFHKSDAGHQQRFASYRNELAQSLRSARVEVVCQEDFVASFGDLLHTLDDEIANSTVVVHLVGDMAGAAPTPEEIRRLHERHPQLLQHEPILRTRLAEPMPISYTQWELYLSYEHRVGRLIFYSATEAPRSPSCRQSADDLRSQKRHREVVESLGAHRDVFTGQDNLCRKVLIALMRQGITPVTITTETTQVALDAAREATPAIFQELAQRIKHPDARAVPNPSPSGTDVLLNAYATVAKARGITPRDLIGLLDQLAEKQAGIAEAGDPAVLYDLAFIHLALGDYEQAMSVADEAAQLARQSFMADPAQAERHRELALNSYLLLSDAAKASRHLDRAILALKDGGNLIDQKRDPLLWADFHKPLAELLFDLAHYEEAERYIRAIVASREERLGENHPKLADALHLLGKLLLALGNYQGSQVIAERILRIEERLPLEERSLVTSALTLLGLALMEEGDFVEAEAPLRLALSIDEKSFGPEDHAVATHLNNLARLLQVTNRLAEAAPLMRRALAIDEKSFGPEHPHVAIHLNNLAVLLQDINRLAEAEPLMRRALAIGEKNFGPEHPNVAKHLNNLAVLLQDINRLGEAESLMRRALAMDEKSFGPEHPNVATHLNNLVRLLKATNRLREAEPLMRRALMIVHKSLGHEHPNTQTALGNYKGLLAAMKLNQEEIETRLREVIGD